MAKYYGEIGYVKTVETRPGVWSESDVTKANYYGDVLETITSRWNGSEHRNNDLDISNRISIVGDPFAFENFAYIKYATYMGIKWEVTSISVEYPRLVLSLGGVYKDEHDDET